MGSIAADHRAAPELSGRRSEQARIDPRHVGVYADVTGAGSAMAARMAVEDFGGTVLGRRIEILVADHQNKAEIAAAQARCWFETQNVVALMDVATSATALAAEDVAKQHDKVIILSGPGTTHRLTVSGARLDFLEARPKGIAVGQIGQSVMAGQMSDARLVATLFGHVLMSRDPSSRCRRADARSK